MYIVGQCIGKNNKTPKETKVGGEIDTLFDMDLNRARLKPISYGSRACTDLERNFHSFLSEAASG